MGFHVSSLHNLPTGNIEYFVHVLDISGGIHSGWINENLHTLALSFGRNTGLVTGPLDLSQELYFFLSKNLSSNFGAIEEILHATTCLVISEGHLANTNKSVYLIPIATREANENSRDLIISLLNLIANSIRNNQLQQLITSLGSQELKLSKINGGFWVCNLRKLNNLLDLRPNIVGIGININAIIDSALPPISRQI